MLPRIEPLRPKLTKTVPRGKQWLYELKLDGFRATLYVENASARFFSKSKKPMPRFRDLASALARQLRVTDAILDGEIIVMGKSGPDFYALMRDRGRPELVAFDLLWQDGRDLRDLPLWRRKHALQKLIRKTSIGFVEHTNDARLFESAVQMDLEGVVAKRRSDPYAPETDWFKIKHAGYLQNAGRHELFDRFRRRGTASAPV